ncbi:hypothetical protein AO067_02790 [Pseudomonas viridiflava ICMP 13104]|uniref:Uncharacterized protein n=1 Tax=Pseudomonas viridiflava ICMP 13104 TaxID=1198305 RepID=A0A0W0H6Q0_PSEVI|nr:hypothetical protein AO067_02790 [Pseudomonas viridiflava ICMP 13104]
MFEFMARTGSASRSYWPSSGLEGSSFGTNGQDRVGFAVVLAEFRAGGVFFRDVIGEYGIGRHVSHLFRLPKKVDVAWG